MPYEHENRNDDDNSSYNIHTCSASFFVAKKYIVILLYGLKKMYTLKEYTQMRSFG